MSVVFREKDIASFGLGGKGRLRRVGSRAARDVCSRLASTRAILIFQLPGPYRLHKAGTSLRSGCFLE